MCSAPNSHETIIQGAVKLNVTVDQVCKIVKKLKPHEIVSLVFLLFDEESEALLEAQRKDSDLLSKWCKERNTLGDTGWPCKLLEALTLTQNFVLLKQFGLNMFDAMTIFQANCLHKTTLVSPFRKTLYFLCENLSQEESQKLKKHMDGEELKDFLEVEILNWIVNSKLSCDLEGSSSLLSGLKKMNKTKLAKTIEDSLGELDIGGVESGEDSYEIINSSRIGVCLILNQETFKGQPERNRTGSERDCKSLEETLKLFNFDIYRLTDLKSEQVTSELYNSIVRYFQPEIHSVLFVVILSHGVQGAIFGIDNSIVPIEEIKRVLLHPFLNKKPKVLVIQACQGTKIYKVPEYEIDGPSASVAVPDLLTCFATTSGCIAIRHVEKGSWYIQAMCVVFKQHPEEDLFSLFTRVNKELKKNKAPIPGGFISMLSEFSSSLSKKIYLKQKKK